MRLRTGSLGGGWEREEGKRRAARRGPSEWLPRADRIAGDDQLHATILLPAGRRVVGRDGRALAEPGAADVALHTLTAKVAAHRVGALLREALVGILGADAVGVPFDLHLQAGMRDQDA